MQDFDLFCISFSLTQHALLTATLFSHFPTGRSPNTSAKLDSRKKKELFEVRKVSSPLFITAKQLWQVPNDFNSEQKDLIQRVEKSIRSRLSKQTIP